MGCGVHDDSTHICSVAMYVDILTYMEYKIQPVFGTNGDPVFNIDWS